MENLIIIESAYSANISPVLKIPKKVPEHLGRNLNRKGGVLLKATTTIPISSIILDEDIYPRARIDQKRVNIRG